LLLLLASPLSAAQLSSGADFLKIDAGARAAGLGRSYTALASDPTALFWNPAGLGLMKRAEVTYQRLQYFGDMSHNFVATGIPLLTGDGTKAGIGLGFVNLAVPSFDSTGGLEPAVASGDMAGIVGFAFAKKGWSVGFDGKFVKRELAGDIARAFIGDAGVMAQPVRFFRFGIAACHVGPGLRFAEEEEPMPTLVRTGFSFTFFEDIHHEMRMSSDHTYQFNGSSYRFGAGLEYRYNQLFSVRGGYSGDHDRRDVSMGGGVDLDFFQVDYAYLPFGKLGDTHRISALIRFGRPDDPERGLRAPNRLTAEAYDRSALVNWTEVYTRDVVGYLLFVKKPGWQDHRQLTKEPLRVTSVKLRKLQNGVPYEVGVVSVTAAGRRSRMVKTIVVPDPSRSLQHLELVPIGLKAEARGAGLALSWEPSVGSVGYNLYLLDAAGGAPKRLNANLLASPAVNLKSLSADRVYRFQVTAVGKDGVESRPSVPVEARVVPAAAAVPIASPAPSTPTPVALVLAPPSSLTVLPGPGSATLSWGAVMGAAGYNVYVSTDGGATWRKLTSTPLAGQQVLLKPLKPRMYHLAVTSVDVNGGETVKALAAPVIPLAVP
jgi:hypothetical protein